LRFATCTTTKFTEKNGGSMIEKLEFYHGAALVRLVEDGRCASISKSDFGYLVNGDRLVLMKYSTKANSPWRFTFSNDDLARFDLANDQFHTCVLALVCGGDGICCTAWEDACAARHFVTGRAAARPMIQAGMRPIVNMIAVRRKLSRKPIVYACA
jgi:hypothetical protein